MQEQEKMREQDQPVQPDSVDQNEQAGKPAEAAAQSAQSEVKAEAEAGKAPGADTSVAQGDSLATKLATAEARASEMQDAFLRAKADAENIRRRAQEDISKAHKFAIENFAESMVPVKDSLEMALKLETPTIESLKEGVEMTLKQLNAAFEKNRLLEINPQPGEKMDPMKHQAISMVPADQAANTIVSVLQKGYMISDRLLRPALVTVAQ
jgi:molecular chaperone GrpE